MAASVKDIAWIAGILEGEGSFGTTNSGRTPCIWVGMTDVDVIERIRLLIDPTKSISMQEDNRKESYKPSYRLTLNGTRAIQWMMTIYSLMGVRRKAKIRQLLDVWKAVELDKKQQRSQGARNRQGLAFRLRRNGYSDNQIQAAKLFSMQGLSDEQILIKMEELGITDKKIM